MFLVRNAHEQGVLVQLKLQFDTSKEVAVHGIKEHREIEDQISRIMDPKDFDLSWVKEVEKLKEIVEHHVSEEEGKIFRHAKKVLSKEETYVIKEQMHYLKQQLLLAFKKDKQASNLPLFSSAQGF